MTRHVAFVRNITLGRPQYPSKETLLKAFILSGATFAESFLASGNIVFDAEDGNTVHAKASAWLREQHGFSERIFARRLLELQDMVASDPFTHTPKDVYERCVTFLNTPFSSTMNLPLASTRGDVEVFRTDALEAYSYTRMVQGRSGYATKLLEQTFGLEVTTRNWNTILRLVNRYAK